METLYNVYFAGEVLPEQDEGAVRQRLQALFKADDQTLTRLFSGKPQMIKRECDKATALKFKQAMERAGAKPVITRAETASAAAPEGTPPPAKPAPKAPETMAERLAALTGEQPQTPTDAPTPAAAVRPEESDESDESGAAGNFDLSPAGSDVLRPEEREQVAAREVDTSALSVAASGERLSATPAPAPAAPNTDHMSMAAAGETIPNLPRPGEVLDPDTSGLDLAPQGSDFSDCAAPPATPPELDLDALAVAPHGSELLDEKYRNDDPAPAPDTSHLSIDKP